MKVENSSVLVDDTLDGIFLAPGKFKPLFYFIINAVGNFLFK